ncbi:MAG: hypothetical protein M3Z25_01920 [Actinomycetota bacterium]|nr:hypothetical protein [Actinomycetota bacterium]
MCSRVHTREGGPQAFERLLLTAEEVAEALHIGRTRVYSLIASKELTTRNVAKMVRTSNPDYEVGGGLDPIAARALLRSIGDNRLYALYLCAIVLGLRRGELLGLTWSAVDLDEGRLVVRQALTWVNGERRMQPPKTCASRRVIPLPMVGWRRRPPP